MNFWKNTIIPNRLIVIILLFYFSLHIINLTSLRIVGDEAIYLDWGWSHTHIPGHLYDAQLDAKQPLMIWFFGIAQNFFADPLLAGRFVTVLFGSLTVVGVYKLAKIVTHKNYVAFLAGLFYTIIPMFVFYNRQALLDASIACVGIWSCVALINVIKTSSTKDSVLLGIVFGIGFFIKTSSVLFLVAALAILGFYSIFHKKSELVKAGGIALLTFVGVDFLVFINPVFWQTLSSNSRYAFTTAELLSFPVGTWINSLSGFFEIGFIFVTPLVFLTGIFGIYYLTKNHVKNSGIFISFFLIALFLEILSVKSQTQRYILPFLPFLVISSSYISYSLWRWALLGKSLVILSFAVPCLITILQIYNPEQYILQTGNFSKYADTGYVKGVTSGYGINEAIQYMKDQSKGQPAMVLFGFTIGNPESAINLYPQRTPNLAPMHTDAQLFPGIMQFDCLTSKYPVFLVTRHDQRLGLEKFLSLEKAFPNPDPTYSVRIYTLKKECKGQIASLSDFYEPTMYKIFQMKKGIY